MRIENEVETARKAAFDNFEKSKFCGKGKISFFENGLKITVHFTRVFGNENLKVFAKFSFNNKKIVELYNSEKLTSLQIAKLIKNVLFSE